MLNSRFTSWQYFDLLVAKNGPSFLSLIKICDLQTLWKDDEPSLHSQIMGFFLVHHQTVWRDRFWPLLFSFFYFFGTWCSTMNEKSPFLYVPWGVKNCRGFGIPTHPQEVYKGHFLGNGQLLRNLISFWETSFRTLCVLWWIPSWQRKVLSVS